MSDYKTASELIEKYYSESGKPPPIEELVEVMTPEELTRFEAWGPVAHLRRGKFLRLLLGGQVILCAAVAWVLHDTLGIAAEIPGWFVASLVLILLGTWRTNRRLMDELVDARDRLRLLQVKVARINRREQRRANPSISEGTVLDVIREIHADEAGMSSHHRGAWFAVQAVLNPEGGIVRSVYERY